MYKVIIGLKEVGEYPNFPEAFVQFFQELERLRETSQQFSPASCWISCKVVQEIDDQKKRKEFALSVKDAMQLADEIGLLKDGKLQTVSVVP
jgi:hypothetical protein